MSDTSRPLRGAPRWPLAAIVAVAAVARVWGLDFGLPFTLARPDEDAVVNHALAMSDGDLNPGFFHYPSLHFYLLHGLFLVTYLTGRVADAYLSLTHFVTTMLDDPSPLYLLSRLVSATLGTASVWLLYRIGRRLADRRVGLVAALFLALCYLHVRESHFGVTDVPTVFWILLSFLWIARYWKGDEAPQDLAMAGIWCGLAGGTKYVGVFLAAPVLLALALRAAGRRWSLPMLVRAGALFAVPCGVTFLATTPFAVVDAGTFFEGLAFNADHLRDGHGVDLGVGWWYHLAVTLRYGLGLPLLVAAAGGAVGWAWRAPRDAAVVLAFPLVYYYVAGGGATVFARYMDPMLPFLCLLGAAGVVALARFASTRLGLSEPIIAAVLAGVVIAPSVARLAWFDLLLSRPDNRLVAREWMVAHISADDSVYRAGGGYAHDWRPPEDGPGWQEWRYDAERELFVTADGLTDAEPAWIVVAESPLHYTDLPPDLARRLESYRPVVALRTGATPTAPRVYDRQDAFFLPLAGFAGLERPGPEFVVYRRADAGAE